MQKLSTLQSYQNRLRKASSYIESHLDEEISLDRLAAITCFSPFHFHRIFTGIVGESVKNYIRRLKLERAIHQLKFTKMKITDIAILAGYNSHEAFTRTFKEKFKMSPMRYRQAQIKKRITPTLKFKTGEIKMKVEIKTVPKIRVACVRHNGPYMACEPAWRKLFSSKNIHCDKNTIILGICYDDPAVTTPEKIRYDACISVDDSFQAADGLDVKTIGGSKYAVTRHIGPHQDIEKVYQDFIGSWIPQNGLELRQEPTFEIYHNDPKTTPPEKLITDIYVPIK